MRACHHDQIGATRRQDRVRVVDRLHVADGHRRHVGFVADLIGEMHLEHTAVDRLRVRRGSSGRHVDDRAAVLLQRPCDDHGVVGRHARGADPVARGDAHGDRLRARPRGAHRVEHLERIAHAVLERAAVRVRALVRQRRQEARQQVAVRHVQLDQVEARLAARCAARTKSARPRQVGARPSRAAPARRAERHRPRARSMASTLSSGTSSALPRPAARALAARVRELHADLRALVRCTNSTMRCHAARAHRSRARRSPA
jgi:hypothetical protein